MKPRFALCAFAFAIALAIAPQSTCLAGDSASFTAKHSRASTQLVLHGSPDASFNLFTPSGERLWGAPHWDPIPVGSHAGPDATGMVFHNGKEKALWVVTRLDASARVIEYLIISDEMLTRLRCEVAPSGDQDSLATVTYDWTSLSEAGNSALEMHAQHFNAQVAGWGEAMNKVLAPEKPAK
ncbi:MAG TPA: hypothetical protein VEZ11_11740 [Thermoanaerobaculia bacterium]|nr:hypothetical protein [Thermoanaerobaculia bacterium]